MLKKVDYNSLVEVTDELLQEIHYTLFTYPLLASKIFTIIDPYKLISSDRDFLLLVKNVYNYFESKDTAPTLDDLLNYIERDVHKDDDIKELKKEVTKKIYDKIDFSKELSFNYVEKRIKDYEISLALVNIRNSITPESIKYGHKEGYPIITDTLSKLMRLSTDKDDRIDVASLDFQNILKQDIKQLVCKFPVNKLNEYLEGIKRKEVIVVGAPSGVGKSYFALACAYKAKQMLNDVLFYNLETSKEDTKHRLVKLITKVYLSKEKAEEVILETTHDMREKYTLTYITQHNEKEIKQLKYNYLHSGGDIDIRSCSEISVGLDKIELDLEIYREKNNKYPDLLVIDALTNLHVRTDKDTPLYKAYEKNVEYLTKLARKYDIGILVTAQLGRKYTSLTAKDKQKADRSEAIADSAGIKQKAEVVITFDYLGDSQVPEPLNESQYAIKLDWIKMRVDKARNSQRSKQFRFARFLRVGEFCVNDTAEEMSE